MLPLMATTLAPKKTGRSNIRNSVNAAVKLVMLSLVSVLFKNMALAVALNVTCAIVCVIVAAALWPEVKKYMRRRKQGKKLNSRNIKIRPMPTQLFFGQKMSESTFQLQSDGKFESSNVPPLSAFEVPNPSVTTVLEKRSRHSLNGQPQSILPPLRHVDIKTRGKLPGVGISKVSRPLIQVGLQSVVPVYEAKTSRYSIGNVTLTTDDAMESRRGSGSISHNGILSWSQIVEAQNKAIQNKLVQKRAIIVLDEESGTDESDD